MSKLLNLGSLVSEIIVTDFLYFYEWLQLYAITKERDTLRREQNKRSDAAALLKEKDEIITQVMAEGRGISVINPILLSDMTC